MTVIIGVGTEVAGVFGVINASWSLDPGLERLWEIGDYRPYDTFRKPRQTLTITAYGRNPGDQNNPNWDLIPAGHPSQSDPCETSNATWPISIFPASCAAVENLININEPTASRWYCESYSYSKGDIMGYGQETWNFFRHIALDDEPVPDTVLQGITTGTQRAGIGVVSNQGVVMQGTAPYEAEGYEGSVAAGPTSLGEMTSQYFGVITSVGGGIGREDGNKGNASATIPHTPLWLGGSY